MVDSTGAIVPSAYVAMAAQMSTDVGIAYRYGPDAASYGPNTAGPLFQRQDFYSRCNGTPLANGSNCQTSWQVGGPRNYDATNDQTLAGFYSTNQATVTFVADDPIKHVGVAMVQTSAHEFNTFAQRPQLPWQLYTPGQGINTPNVLAYKAAGVTSGSPTATGRCEGPTGFCGESIVAFQNGALGSAGSNTANNASFTTLAPNKVPTGVAVSNDNEFAFVTVWDTAALKGQVAVIALAGLCDGCDAANPAAHTTNGVSYAAWHEWWHEWVGLYPGLPNMGNTAFMKVVGYIDLPFATPTEIAVTTGLHAFDTVYGGGSFMGADNSPLQDHWQSFASGGANFNRYAKGGMAVVLSKSENKVAFIDLKPLYSYINSMYFSAQINTLYPASNPQLGIVGQGPTQWPYTFDNWGGAALPAVVKTVTLAKPTAVKTTITGDTQRAWIATQDGTLHIFSLDKFAPGGTVKTGNAAAIVEVGSISGLGRNPTSMAVSKGDPDALSGDSFNAQVIVLSRGDRKISWARFSADGNSGSIVRTITDSHMVDPLRVEDADNFATPGNTLTVADYGGKQLLGYRYGPVIFAEQGSTWACQAPSGCAVNATGAINAEFGGAMAMPGKPFQLNTSNVP